MKRTRSTKNRHVSAFLKTQSKIRRNIFVGCAIAIFTMMMFAITPTILGSAMFQIADSYSQVIERPWAEAPKYTKQEEVCLTQAVYYEAANQTMVGKEAVALVILNRVASKEYPHTICGVVHQSMKIGEKRICQFSYHCMRYYTPNPQKWAESKLIAQKSLKNFFDRDIIFLVGRSQYFHATYVYPQWAKQKHRMAKIGDHVFYREREL